MKQYKAIFFDWDGTAVASRKAPPGPVIGPMKALLQKRIPLIIISGTTYENIAQGELESLFTPEELKYLFLGIGRGSYNYRFDAEGRPVVFQSLIPSKQDLLRMHEVCFAVHQKLLAAYDIPTDIIFSRPNYCKIDLQVGIDRGDQLFLQTGEREALLAMLARRGFNGGVRGLIELCADISANYGMPLSVTCDAKFLEMGISTKSDNVDAILSLLRAEYGISPADCCYWGDEYLSLGDGLFGSDSFMITTLSRPGDFFDVSDGSGQRPEGVARVGGRVEAFLAFLRGQGEPR